LTLFGGIGLAQADTFNFVNFNSLSGLAQNGYAGYNGSNPAPSPIGQVPCAAGGCTGQALELTNNRIQESASVWYTTPVTITGGFTSIATVNVPNVGDYNGGVGDGYAIVVQNSAAGTAAQGVGGSGVGFGGITNGVAVDFDMTYGQLSIIGCGTAALQFPGQVANSSCSIATAYLTNGITGRTGLHTLELIYTGLAGSLSVFLDGVSVITSSGDPFAGMSFLAGGQAYVGVTAGTGDASEFTDFQSWCFNSSSSGSCIAASPTETPEPAAAVQLGVGLLALGAMWSKRRLAI
jgi:hypothetical protein